MAAMRLLRGQRAPQHANSSVPSTAAKVQQMVTAGNRGLVEPAAVACGGRAVPGGVLYEGGKRALDVTVAFAGLVMLLPLMVAIGLVLRVTSGRPILYRAVRTGRYGRSFIMLKFRSMVAGEGGPGTTSRNDRRVTVVGRFLRRHKLDELPQLWNVLLGEMSIVGPRPELPKYTARYEGDELLILCVRPGLTDLASVAYSNLSALIPDDDPDGAYEAHVLRDKNRQRLEYVRSRSLLVDLQIMLRTLAVVVGR